ncbi:MAG: glycosyltransferase family 4 protein [Muribaculum sp.]|nr:glycosyltransferase family 4 protein [Muribaculum sp.]
MERVLLNKVSWLVNHGHEVMVVTTDQDGRAPFYNFPESVRMIDLGINYSADNTRPVHIKILNYLRKRRIHRHRLSELLMRERPDITVSLYPSESSFIPDIKDGSKKVLELHFNRYFRIQYGRKGLLGIIDKWRSRNDTVVAGKFDSFVVLSKEDRGYWGNMDNIAVIPNSAVPLSDMISDCSSQRVIAVGRLDFQKGFDRLLRIWAKVKADKRFIDWHLDIFGQGEWRDRLLQLAVDLGIADSVNINDPVKNISDQYLNSSILAMTSNYEGFPMVMIEAMEMGLPVVSYDFKCGPKDIIKDGHNGILVRNGDEPGFVKALVSLMADEERRKVMGVNAHSVIDVYAEDVVMQQWMQLFNNLTK